MADGQHMVNMIVTGYLTEENAVFSNAVRQIFLRREFENKMCMFNTQNHIKTGTNDTRIFAFYIAFIVHIIQMMSTILKNKQSQTF